MMSATVTAEKLTKKIGNFTAVDGVTFHVEQGEIFGFLGSNGAGKTTTIRMLCGIIPPTSGTGTILGMDIVADRNRIKHSIGYMSQKFSLYEDLTIRENLQFFSGMYGVGKESATRITDALEKTGLVNRAKDITSSLPFGIKQRLALASALLHQPKILFLDEPTAGVDPQGRRHFWNLINELAAAGVTVFVTTHYMDEAEYCNRIALLDRGQLKALGSPASLKRERMHGAILEVKSNDTAATMSALKKAGIGQAALFANAVHLNVVEAAEGKREATSVLKERGIGIDSIEVVTPSLEDVFISVLGNNESVS